MDATIERDGSREWLAIVHQQVESLRYGVVQIVVHDAKVVQIERTEKVRLDGDRSRRKGRDVLS